MLIFKTFLKRWLIRLHSNTTFILFFYNEPKLGVGIDPGMALTPLPSSIGQGSNPRPSDREPSALPLDHSFCFNTTFIKWNGLAFLPGLSNLPSDPSISFPSGVTFSRTRVPFLWMWSLKLATAHSLESAWSHQFKQILRQRYKKLSFREHSQGRPQGRARGGTCPLGQPK